MIILITGSLGTGKTALAVKLLTESKNYPDNAVIVGVREWQGGGAYYSLKSQENAVQNQQLIEDIGTLSGTVYLVDEAKKIWPSRIAGKPAPGFIDTHLAESRSIAQDWILTAQAPTQIDVSLRRLVGRHIHLELTPFGVKYSESGSIREDLKFTRDESRKYSFPVESLKLYKSDDGVTDSHKKGLKMPKRLLMLALLIVGLGTMITYFATQSSLFSTMFKDPEEVKAEILKENSPSSPSMSQLVRPQNQQSKVDTQILPITHAPSVYYYFPSDPGIPELAKAPRLPVSCISNKDRCICYDQYSQRINDFPEKRCRDIVAGVNQVAYLMDMQKSTNQ